MYKVSIENGTEKVLSGTDQEIRNYYRLLWMWHKRHNFYWILLSLQIAPLIAMLLFADISKIYCLIAMGVILTVHTVLWRTTLKSYPYEHPIYNLIKKHLLITGKCVLVMSTRKDGAIDSAIENIYLGYYNGYDSEKKRHIVTIPRNGDEYFLFHQIIPVDTKRKKYEPTRFDYQDAGAYPLKCFGGFPAQDSRDSGNK